MKTFLNVLYRRILYKIPLKFLLVLLAITAVFIACFSSAVDLPSSTRGGNTLQNDGSYSYGQQNFSISSNTTINLNSNYDFVCFHKSTQDSSCQYSQDGVNWVLTSLTSLSCVKSHSFTIKGNCGSTYFFYFKEGSAFVPSSMSSLECQTEYNLIPISSVDENYCTTNNLCPSCPSCPSCPVGSGGRSTLYINNILHVGAPNIIMNIPDEIDWDYAYTMGGNNMNIDVVGYNVDYEKIDNIVQNQSYIPTQEDFNSLILVLVPYTKIIIVFIVLLVIWARVKKPFKSKKL